MLEEKIIEIKGNPFYRIAHDIANGKVGDYFYCLQDGRYYVYEDNYWKEILETKFLSQIQSKLIGRISVKVGDNIKYEQGQLLIKYSPSQKKQIIEHFKVLKFKELDDLNKGSLINLENFMFDPIGFNIISHNKEHYSTMRIPYNYDSLAQCPLWINTLDEIFEGNKDKISTLQEFCGYCLTPKNNQKKALLLLGESDSGKSTILYIIRKILGEQNCSNVALKCLNNQVYLYGLMNKMANIDSDVSRDAQSYEAEFKMITSNEPIHCNPKYVKPFDFIPTCKMIMAANIFPKITDHSSAFYNRLILIPFTRVFKQNEQDKELWIKLENELPGIFNWFLEGLKRLNMRGRFEHHNFIKQAVKDLENENNPTNIFFEEYIEKENGAYEIKKNLYDNYVAWCRDTNTYQLSEVIFGKCLMKYFPNVERDSRLPGGGPRIWRNLKYVHFKADSSSDNLVEMWNEK